MKKILQFLVKTGNSINETVGRLAAWLTLVLVIVVCIEVVRRYIFGSNSIAMGELQWHIFALIFLLGAGYAFRHDRHVRVDLFYARYAKRDQAMTNAIGGILFLIPWCIFILIFSWGFVKDSFINSEISPNPNGLPFRFLIKAAIPIGFSLLFLQALASVSQSLLTLFYKKTS